MHHNARTLSLVGALALMAPAPATASGLPTPANSLKAPDVSAVLERAIARARQLGVNATIGVIDPEGTILGLVRMTDPALPADAGVSTITGGGTGGVEGVTLSSAITATSKAGTGAFLSTSFGNAFTTRTAGFIIQPNFPPSILFQDSGPLFGVQFSSLPTSDVMRLPLGLSADPGGLPLHRAGEIVGGVGVELNGTYTVDLTPRTRVTTPEEQIAAAGQSGLEPPASIRADKILVDGLRLAYQNTATPRAGSIATTPLATLAGAGIVNILLAPRDTGTISKFVPATVGTVSGQTLRDFTASRYEAVAVGEGSLFAARVRPDRAREIVRVGVPTGGPTLLFTITGGANRLSVNESVCALLYDDNLTPGLGATADDRFLVFASDGRLYSFAAPTGAPAPAVTLANQGAKPKDAVFFNDGGVRAAIALSASTGQLFKIALGAVGSPGSFTALTTTAQGTVQSFALGAAGLHAIRELPAPAPVGARQLVRVSTSGAGITVVQTLTDGGANEPAVGQNLFALGYDDNGTAAAADDVLNAQNSTLARQFRMNAATGAIGAAPVALPNRLASFTVARFLTAGAQDYLVGISKQTRRLFAVRADLPAPPANTIELTPADGGAGPGAASFTRAGRFFGPPSTRRQLTQAEVERILRQAHELNAMLRAMIRRDRPQVSQVNVSVVDAGGELIGFFRTPDAPVFGVDVSSQKARSAALLSSPDGAARLNVAEGARFAPFVAAANAIGFSLDGRIAHSDRSIGFVSRPLLPDGLPGTAPGPLSIRAPDRFSVFNTGLQTDLFVTRLVAFLTEFGAVGSEGLALDLLSSGVIGAGGAADPSLGLASGLQIFPGSVPLYKNGVLVGAVGVSGDGIEQDDFVAFNGSDGFRPSGVSPGGGFPAARTSDNFFITLNGTPIRLPYVKLPRNPFAGR